ncbi:MAG: MarR family winged helix-turn-helix transcriptional regulator [Anaerovoracaceae bacterium]|jgi:DNA-binding MarR family transcriptional regulator
MKIKLDYPIQYMKIIVERMQKLVNRVLQDYDLTFSQLRILLCVYVVETESCTMKELEQILQVSQQSVAGTVRRLEEKDYLLSYSDKNDQRVKRVELTEKGRDMAFLARDKMVEVNKEMFRPLSQEEQDEMTEMLKKVYFEMYNED